MTDFQKEMNRAVNGFVAHITDLAHRAATNMVESTFGARGAGRTPTASPTSTASVGRPRGVRDGKRTSEDLEALSRQFASFVKSHPGLRIEQINKELGTSTKDLALPIRKLVADGVVSAKGNKRSTKYFPGKKAKS